MKAMNIESSSLEAEILEQLKLAKLASVALAALSTSQKNFALELIERE